MKITAEDFVDAFNAAFIVNRRNLRWDTPHRRTANMIAYIYRTIATSFPGLEIEYEHSKIDAVFYHKSRDNIILAIEHENDVKSIENELNNFVHHKYSLNILITYTGNREEYLFKRQKHILNKLSDHLLLILNPENVDQIDESRHNLVLWDYLLWKGDGYISLSTYPPKGGPLIKLK